MGHGPKSLERRPSSKRPSWLEYQYKEHGPIQDNELGDLNLIEVPVKQVVGRSWKHKIRGKLENVNTFKNGLKYAILKKRPKTKV